MKKFYKVLLEYFFITVGTIFIALGLVLFLAPNTIAPGGVTGLAIVINKVTNIPIYMINLGINIPLFVIGVFTLGKAFGTKTAYGTIVLSLFILLFDDIMHIQYATKDILLAAVYGGILVGVGVGLVFRNGGTTGGTDLGGAILNKYFPSLSIAKLMMVIDLIIVVLAGIVDGKIETALYSIISLYILVKVADFLVDGLNYAKAFYIITSSPEEISKQIIAKLDRGVTALNGTGMYTGDSKQVLMCVVNRAQVSKLKDIVLSYDERAFIMVTTVHEVLGEGFKEIE